MNSVTFEMEGHRIMKKPISQNCYINNRRFRSFFGVSPEICYQIWCLTKSHHRNNSKPVHLLMSLHFLKCYSTETINASIFDVDEKTYRKWQWEFVNLIAYTIDVINFKNRFDESIYEKCYISIDGTDFPIEEPTYYDPKWYSHKFKGPGLRYEIGLSIATGDIVWSYGGVTCGEYPDLKLARERFIHKLDDGELVIADRGYNDKKYFINPNYDPESSSIQKQIMKKL